MKTKKTNKRFMALSQIIILLIATIAFSYLVSENFKVVGAQQGTDRTPNAIAATAETAKRIADLSKSNVAPPANAVVPAKSPEINILPRKVIEQSLGAVGTLQPSADKIYTIDNVNYFYDSDMKTPIDAAKLAELRTYFKGTNTVTNPALTAANPLAQKQESAWKGIGKDFLVSATVLGAIQGMGRAMGLKDTTVNAASFSLSAGWLAGRTSWRLFKSMGQDSWLGKNAAIAGGVVGLGVAAIIFLMMYKKTDEETIQFQCLPWQPSTGGANCEECNKQGILPCSKYQCKSLGQACELLNEGTKKETCTWVNRHDVNPPEIRPLEDVLAENTVYTPDNTISPPDYGVKVKYMKSTNKDGCVKAFTPLSFGVQLNEPAVCKLDNIATKKMSEMQFFFGGDSLYAYNHSLVMSLPGPNALNNESPTLENDGVYSLFVKCSDANGNENLANFIFRFCVDKGPDTTPPLIVTTDILNGMPIQYNKSSLDLTAYVNEPSTCKWSRKDQSYNDMENTMACSSSVFEMNAQMLYKCKTTLVGLKNNADNKFYFRCKDQPKAKENDRNVNTKSYEYSVKGTQPLTIASLAPNETVKDSTNSVKATLKVETENGYDNGKATCYYGTTGATGDYVMFFETNKDKPTHTQDLYLAEGSYKYYIKCIDLGGNEDNGIIEFNVETDVSAPSVVRIYKEENYLKLITDEQASCAYSRDRCSFSFADGIALTTVKDTSHFTDWNVNADYYIKCKDKYGNQPLPNECSILVRPVELTFSQDDSE